MLRFPSVDQKEERNLTMAYTSFLFFYNTINSADLEEWKAEMFALTNGAYLWYDGGKLAGGIP